MNSNEQNQKLKPVLITTKHKGVWFAKVGSDQDLTAPTLTNLKDAKMAIYWGTTKGLQQLCDSGPTSSSRISAPSDILVLHDVTAVFNVSEEAEKVWENA